MAEAKKTAKATVKKPVAAAAVKETKAAAVKEPAVKKTAAKKTTTRTAAAKKAAAVETNISIQFAGKEYTTEQGNSTLERLPRILRKSSSTLSPRKQRLTT